MQTNSMYPGFRFQPTDDELVNFYLKNKIMGKKLLDVIPELDLYKYSPLELPDKFSLRTGDLTLYFFCSRAMKYTRGGRIKRTTPDGYWKATGRDKRVPGVGLSVGMRKSLVFHKGKAPNADNTNWVMHEYRLDAKGLLCAGAIQLDSYVLCKIFQKGVQNNVAQYGEPSELDWGDGSPVAPAYFHPPIGHLINTMATPSNFVVCDAMVLSSDLLQSFPPAGKPVQADPYSMALTSPQDSGLLDAGATAPSVMSKPPPPGGSACGTVDGNDDDSSELFDPYFCRDDNSFRDNMLFNEDGSFLHKNMLLNGDGMDIADLDFPLLIGDCLNIPHLDFPPLSEDGMAISDLDFPLWD